MTQIADPPHHDADCLAAIAAFARAGAGVCLGADKHPMMRARLCRRMNALGISDLASYNRFLHSTAGRSERRRLLSALTTHVSAYFREPHHFDSLGSDILPPLASLARRGRPLRLWSAGTAAGQEAYSIAMTLLNMFPDAPLHDVAILATDLDTDCLDRARSARISVGERAQIPDHLARNYTTQQGQSYRLTSNVRSLVHFQPLNLLSAWPMSRPFDVIFCRNVLIHLDHEVQEQICMRLVAQLAPGGWLVLGHAERPTGRSTRQLAPMGRTIYRSLLSPMVKTE